MSAPVERGDFPTLPEPLKKTLHGPPHTRSHDHDKNIFFLFFFT